MRPAPKAEAQLDKGPHAVRQDTVIDLVHVRPVVNGIPLGIFAVNAVVVVEDVVEVDVTEIGDRLRGTQVLPPALPKVRFACPEPNICSQKCGNGLAGAPGSTRMTSEVGLHKLGQETKKIRTVTPPALKQKSRTLASVSRPTSVPRFHPG